MIVKNKEPAVARSDNRNVSTPLSSTPPTANPPAVEPSATTPPAGSGLGLDDAALSANLHGDDLPPLAPSVARQGDDGRPYCAKHNVLMRAYATKDKTTHYACPVKTCNERQKRVRKEFAVPTEPQICPDVRCHGQKRALEVDPKLSKLSQLHMVCPKCGFSSKVPRPQFKPILSRQRANAVANEDLAAR